MKDKHNIANTPTLLYSTSETAAILKTSKHTIYKYVQEGVLMPIKIRVEEGKQLKHSRSYFDDAEVIKAIDYRFILTPGQKQRLRERLRRR